MIAAIVLAAGESRRMGRPKARLPFPEPDGSESTFLTHVVRVLTESRARPIIVVLGHGASELERDLQGTEARAVRNPAYRDGMLSSIQAGVRALSDEPVEGLLVLPVDQPAVSAAVVDRIIARFEEGPAPVVLPRFAGRRGHPVLFAREVWSELLEAPAEVGARRVVWDHQDALVEIDVDDAGVTIDVDTPSDYERFRERDHGNSDTR